MDMGRMELMTRTFLVPFTHRVIFTRGVAGAGNPALDEAVGDSRLAMLVVEDAVASAWPGPGGGVVGEAWRAVGGCGHGVAGRRGVQAG